MTSELHLARRLVPAALALTALTSLAPVARAQTPSPTDPNVIWACYVPLSGTVYRIKTTDTKENCTAVQHVMFWFNQTGPQGPQGPQGVPGPAGAAGATGAQGPAGEGSTAYFRALTARVTPGFSYTGLIPLNLPAGSYVITARVRVSHFGDTGEGSVNCSVGIGGTQLANSTASLTRVIESLQSSFVVVGVYTSASPFTATLDCNGPVLVAVDAGTNILAIKLGSLVIQ
jgi:hypothetical protein